MAYIVDYAITENAAGGGSPVTCNVPTHQTNDYLVCMASVNGTTTFTMTGWTQIGTTQTANAGISTSAWYKKAASSSETASLTIGTPDDYTIKIISVRDADGTTFLSGTPISTNNTATATQWTSPAVTTADADTLVIYFHGYDGVTPMLHSDPGTMFLVSSDSTGTTAASSAGSAIAWYIQRSIGASPTPGWTCNTGDDRTNHVFAIKNAASGKIPAYIDDSVSVAQTIMEGHHFQTAAVNNIAFPTAVTISNIGPSGSGKTFTYDAGALVADYGKNPYSSSISNTPAATAATGVAGFEVTLTNTIDFSSGFIVGNIIASTPKMANYNHGSVAQGGTYITLASGTTANTDYRSYQIAARDSLPNTEGRMVFSVQPSQSTTAFGTNGSFSASAVKRILFGSNCPTATITLYTDSWFKVGKIGIAGGDSINPVDAEGLNAIGKSFRVDLLQKTGASGILALVPIQIGGGDAVNFQIDAGSLQFPRIYSQTKKEINYHGSAGSIGISYAGKSGDVISHTNSVVTSASTYYWEINSAATSAATWDFTGLTVVNANVTLRNVMTFSGMTFSSCPTIDATGCTIDGCSFSKLSTSNDSLTTNASTNIDNSTINTTSITAGNRWCSVADPSIFSGNQFVGSGTSGHAIRITTAGTYSLIGNTFTGYGGIAGSNLVANSGSTSAAIFNDSGGAVTLNISGGSSPSIRNGVGATTTVNNANTFTITNIVPNSEVRIFRTSDQAEVAGVEEIGTTAPSNCVIGDDGSRKKLTYSHNESGLAVYIVVTKTDYQHYYQDYTINAETQSLLVSQIPDRNFKN